MNSQSYSFTWFIVIFGQSYVSIMAWLLNDIPTHSSLVPDFNIAPIAQMIQIPTPVREWTKQKGGVL